MANEFNLYKQMIQLVETQIKEKKPPATHEAFKRLVNNGKDEDTAKEMIARVMAEEIYYMMKDERDITEEFYAKRLNELE